MTQNVAGPSSTEAPIRPGAARFPSLPTPVRLALALAVLVSRAGFAQARVLSAPPEPSLLNITRQWSRASSLGDLREVRAGRDLQELRVWGGYGLATRTQGVVLRRDAGQWSAFLARVLRCEIEVPKAVWDTASRATTQRYTEEARRRCGTPVGDVAPGARILTTDSLLVQRLGVPDSLVEQAWAAAMRAGVSRLPGHVERGRAMDDGFAYVIELRTGGDYRASAIEHVEGSDADADRRVRDVYAAVSRLLPLELVLRP